MASRLKTYWAQIDGLHDWAVAAPNQRAALDALGVNQDLFAQGEAGVSDEVDAVAGAQSHPGQPVRRKKGGKGAYELAQSAGGWEAALEALPKAKKPKPPSRAPLDKAEAALEALQVRREAVIDALDQEEAALADRRRRAQAEFEEKEAEARERVERERARFEGP